ncbi:MAG: Veg family protein [Eubacteriales bacterium]
MEKNSLDQIKRYIFKKNGSRVVFLSKNGRRGYQKQTGIIDGVYPDIFTIYVSDNNINRRFSYTYADILTNIIHLVSDKDDFLAGLK